MAKTRRAPVLHLLLAVLALAGALSAARAEFANPSGVAVIIGNRTYAGDIPAVDYAHRDADAFRRYVVDVLGFDPENVIDLRDATQAQMWSTFGNRTTVERSELWSYLEDEGSDVVVFYSGHGAPGLDDRRGYLLPVDADPNTAELNGYPIDLLYENLARLAEAKTARVYLDACFSGGSGGGGMLIEGASPVFVEAPLPEAGEERLSVLSAASGKQLASWDRKAKHGLFTHHLLDALYGAGDADSDGRVTAREAKAYLDRHMTRAAKRTWKRRQKASFAGNPDAVLAHAGAGGAFPARPSLDDSGAVAGGAADTAGLSEALQELGEKAGQAALPTPGPKDAVARDKYLLGAELAFESKDYPKVLEYVRRLEELDGALPSVVVYYRGEAEFRTGRPGEAIRSLNRYVEEAGREGRYYRHSLGLLLKLDERDDEAYARAELTATATAFGTYLASFPEGRHAEEARRRESAHRAEADARQADDEAFAHAKTLNTPTSYQAYLERGGRHEAEALELLAEVKWPAGKKFRDCAGCPEMVVVPAGSYGMGSPPGEAEQESAWHRVTIEKRFAVGVYEVTRGEWSRYASETGHEADWCWSYEDQGWLAESDRSWRNPGFVQSDTHPVVCVNWDDARQFVRWLSRKTGAEYRMLSESEWEYVARGGTSTSRYWERDESDQCDHANGADGTLKTRYPDWKDSVVSCVDGHLHTAPVGIFGANDYGLHDVFGNAWEWVEDCWHEGYSGAPSDGSPWTHGGDCRTRVLRGGSWGNGPGVLRATYRNDDHWGGWTDNANGFRVARTLD